MKPVKTN